MYAQVRGTSHNRKKRKEKKRFKIVKPCIVSVLNFDSKWIAGARGGGECARVDSNARVSCNFCYSTTLHPRLAIERREVSWGRGLPSHSALLPWCCTIE